MAPLAQFRSSLERPALLDYLRSGLIGDGVPFNTPFGRRELLYADYVASGRALRQVEAFVTEEVLPFYANSHTEASYCGETMSRMREEARAIIARDLGATADCHVIFAGSGATAGINRIVGLLCVSERVNAGERVVVLSGPYEHHSNILPWREAGAEIHVIPEAQTGGVNLGELEEMLKFQQDADLVIGSFSAASNVTGIVTQSDPVTRLLKRYGALAIWDYAGGAPYLSMNMTPEPGAEKDAIVFSPHKYPGGPGASGVLVVRDSVVQRRTPTAPGGGTVSFVSNWHHAYSSSVAVREEAGTPNVVGDIRAALAILIKDAIGCGVIHARDTELRERAIAKWSSVVGLRLLGLRDSAKALPIFSFQIDDGSNKVLHHQLVTRMLSDVHGIQARGGCACAGPYAHQLLGLNRAASEQLFARLEAGHEIEKPGWVRLNLSYLHSDAQVDRIIGAVAELPDLAQRLAHRYAVDPVTARFRVTEPLAG